MTGDKNQPGKGQTMGKQETCRRIEAVLRTLIDRADRRRTFHHQAQWAWQSGCGIGPATLRARLQMQRLDRINRAALFG